MFVPENLFTLIIPCYNESADVIDECLASVTSQQFFDFKCMETLIVVDGNRQLYNELDKRRERYRKLNLRIIELAENGGAGVARNAGIDAAKGEYILFADCDDVYFDVMAFANMYKAVTDNHAYPDYLWGRFLEEAHYAPKLNKPPELVPHNDTTVWSFAKLCKRSLLNKYNIRFLPDARIYEDTYFCGMCYALAPSVTFMDSMLYFWRWHDDSTIRKNSETNYYKRHADIIKVNAALINDLQTVLETCDLSAETAAKVTEIMNATKAASFVSCYTIELEARQLQPGLLDFVRKINRQFVTEHEKWYNPLDAQMRLAQELPQKAANGIAITQTFEDWQAKTARQAKLSERRK